MKTESKFMNFIGRFLYLAMCMFLVKGGLVLTIIEHKKERRVEKEMEEAFYQHLALYTLYMEQKAEAEAEPNADADSVYASMAFHQNQ